jgi:5-methylcytosine-specific restriction endonuclease McrA
MKNGKWVYDPKPEKKEKDKKRKKIRPLSVKRAEQNKEYLLLRKLYLQEHNYCEMKLPGCTNLANDLHHKNGRTGNLLTDISNFMAVCRSCHSKHHG